MKHFNMNTVLVRTSALLLALMLCMTAFGCSNVQSISNDKQTSHESADELTKGSSLSAKTTEIPEPTVEPTAEPTVEPTPEPTSEPTMEQIPMDVLAPLREPAPTYDYEKIILDLYEHINEGDIIGFANSFAPNIREEHLKSAKNEWNKEHGEYYYNFKHVDVLEIIKLNERYCRPGPDQSCNIDEELLLDTDNFDCYYVKINLDVFTSGGRFSDGELELIITILKEAGDWYVADMRGYMPDHHCDPTWMKFIDDYYDNMDK